LLELAQALPTSLDGPLPDPAEGRLTARRQEVALLVAAGLTNREIAHAGALPTRSHGAGASLDPPPQTRGLDHDHVARLKDRFVPWRRRSR
jgi:hypothetical protein